MVRSVVERISNLRTIRRHCERVQAKVVMKDHDILYAGSRRCYTDDSMQYAENK